MRNPLHATSTKWSWGEGGAQAQPRAQHRCPRLRSVNRGPRARSENACPGEPGRSPRGHRCSQGSDTGGGDTRGEEIKPLSGCAVYAGRARSRRSLDERQHPQLSGNARGWTVTPNGRGGPGGSGAACGRRRPHRPRGLSAPGARPRSLRRCSGVGGGGAEDRRPARPWLRRPWGGTGDKEAAGWTGRCPLASRTRHDDSPAQS